LYDSSASLPPTARYRGRIWCNHSVTYLTNTEEKQGGALAGHKGYDDDDDDDDDKKAPYE
jgi:hypothetical protein